MRKIKIYEVKSGSAENAKKLFSDDSNYFYWNNAKFLGNEIGDIVFIVNRHANWVCLTEIYQKDITTKQDRTNRTSSFSFRSKNYTVSDPDGVYNVFIEFKIIEKKELSSSWNWTKQLGQSETYDLVKEGIQGQTERISKIDDLVKVFESGEGNNILKEALEFLKSGKSISQPKNQSNIKSVKTESDYMNILTAIKTKPFILLAGISGTGKSRLVRTLAYKTCSKQELRNDPKKPGNFELIPVRPNWHDSSELMGYVSRINGEKYITTSFLKFIAKAWQHTDVPFFLCLDEMNLAPVEQYFAEYLSIIETRQVKKGKLVTDYIISKESFENQKLYTNLLTDLGLAEREFSEGIGIPNNLIVIGTVNMDETTHSFSRKVLDRAMTFEMNNVDLTAGLELSKNDWSYPESFISKNEIIGNYTSGAEVYSQTFKEKDEVIGFLKKINNELDGTPFKIAYRVRDEFLIYCFYASLNPTANWLTNALDEMTSMKILSRIEGDETKTGKVLTNLQRIITADFKKSYEKIKEMETRLQSNGYTSFWS
jgi:energy-coupling factor transporter ATP-binding protein EcfA2